MEYLKDFLATYKSEGKSEHTLYGYGLDIRAFFGAIGKGTSEVTPLDARRYFNSFAEENKMQRTRNRALAALNSYYKFCIDEDLVKENPLKKIKPAKVAKTVPKFFSYEDYRRMVDACPVGSKERAILTTLYSTAARVSELCGMDKAHLDLANRRVLIRNGKGNKERRARLTDEAVEALSAYWATRADQNPAAFVHRGHKHPDTGEWVPPQRIIPATVQKMTKKLGKKLGIEVRTNPHCFRKSNASHMVQDGVDILIVSKYLGHADVSTTMIYAGIRDEDQAEAFEKAINSRCKATKEVS